MNPPIEILRRIPPFMPQFLQKRRIGLPIVSELMKQLGLDRTTLFTMVNLNTIMGAYGGIPVTLSQMRATEPYSAIDTFSDPLSILVEKRLVSLEEEGRYSLSPAAKEIVGRLHTAGRAHVAAMHPLSERDLANMAFHLQRAVNAILSDAVLAPRPGSRLRGYRSLAVPFDAPTMVRIEQQILELWGARDDAHVKAWRDAGMEGPPMDVLTHVWSGKARTVPELQEALQYQQTPTDIESSLAYLLEKDYIVREGDNIYLTPDTVIVREDIEQETDRIYFTPWPHTPSEAEWLAIKMQELVDNLPALPPPAE